MECSADYLGSQSGPQDQRSMQGKDEKSCKGIIYCLISQSGLRYVGSSCWTPQRRLQQHWYDYVRFKNGIQKRKMQFVPLFEQGKNNVEIVVLFSGFFQSRRQRQKMELKYIRELQCVNKYHAGRLPNERQPYNKKYADCLRKIKVICPRCKKEYNKLSFYTHRSRQKCEEIVKSQGPSPNGSVIIPEVPTPTIQIVPVPLIQPAQPQPANEIDMQPTE